MRLLALFSALIVTTMALSASADTTITGEKKGAFYQITVPTAWNGGLVVYNHGFDFNPPAPGPDLGPLAPVMLSQGYAIAATSYRQCCWALFQTKKDLNKLLAIFEDNFGAPTQLIAHGFSLGGIVTAQALEKVADFDGAYPLCGALAGSRSWDGAIDIRLIFDTVCANTPSAAIPGGATGFPAPGWPDAFGGDYNAATGYAALKAHQCMGVFAPPAFRTPTQTANLAQFLAATTIPEEFVVTDVVYSVLGYSNLIHAPEKLDGEQGVGNAGVTYTDPIIDANIQRVTAAKKAAKRTAKFFTPKGDIGATKIVSLHTDKDGLVIVEHESEYQSVVPASQLSVGVAVEATPTHCGFTEAETVGGWLALQGWLAGGGQPSATDLQNTCLAAEFGGAGGPCRIDPGYVIGNFDDRVLPR